MTIVKHAQWADLQKKADLPENDPDHLSREVLQSLFFGKSFSTIKWLGGRLHESQEKVLSDLEDYRAGRLVRRAEPTTTSAIVVPKPRRILTSDQVRRIRAKRLFEELHFDNGVRGTTAKTLNQYLAGIPPIPDHLFKDDTELFMLPLVDPRPGLTKSCGLIGIKYAEYGYNDDSVEPWNDHHCDLSEPSWVRCHDGRPNRGRKPDDCRAECTGNRLAGTAMVGIMAYAHFPNIVKEGEYVADLPGSVNRASRADCAYLEVWGGRSRLFLRRNTSHALPSFGSVVARRGC